MGSGPVRCDAAKSRHHGRCNTPSTLIEAALALFAAVLIKGAVNKGKGRGPGTLCEQVWHHVRAGLAPCASRPGTTPGTMCEQAWHHVRAGLEHMRAGLEPCASASVTPSLTVFLNWLFPTMNFNAPHAHTHVHRSRPHQTPTHACTASELHTFAHLDVRVLWVPKEVRRGSQHRASTRHVA
eukprot:364961-Chlamydomonas_euryale.AAC.4